MSTSVTIEKLEHGRNLPLPSYATPQSAGMDLFAAIEVPIVIATGKSAVIPAGFCMALPPGYEAQIRSRSGLAARNGVVVLNSPGTIDADYRGEIKVILINHGDATFIVEHGMRIAQMIVSPHASVNWHLQDSLENDTERGSAGFGSTGLRITG
ncbi:MAG: dUTP diphosphatase [Alphaproteobacteria bacterium]|nr:MAG: dUTP diphosphatase [Alphaproteobacteria bacterium]